MEIAFARETANAPFKNDVTRVNSSVKNTRTELADSVSDGIRAGLRSAEADTDELLQQTVAAGASENVISEAHDFNMERVMALLSDPLLQEDI